MPIRISRTFYTSAYYWHRFMPFQDAENQNRYVYTNGGNQAMMIKSNGGSGTLQNVVFEQFLTRGAAYGLNVNQYWSGQSTASGDGVQLYNITFLVRPLSSCPSVLTNRPHTGRAGTATSRTG